ncbi:MAG: hypothetical protein AVDCRST_MAG08-4484, partial [uncultured Acetobacteraceae bacterium]
CRKRRGPISGRPWPHHTPWIRRRAASLACHGGQAGLVVGAHAEARGRNGPSPRHGGVCPRSGRHSARIASEI